MSALDPVNALAAAAPGFVWRPQTEDGDATAVPSGHRPTTAEAEDRIRHLRAHGPTPHAFTLRQTFAPESEAEQPGRPDWLCPA